MTWVQRSEDCSLDFRRLLRLSGPPSKPQQEKLDTSAWKTARSTASAGQLREFASAYARAVAIAAEARADERQFRHNAEWLIRFAFESADIDTALRDLDRASSLGLKLPIDPDIQPLLDGFIRDHGALLEDSRKLVSAAAAARVPEANADLRLIGWLRLLYPSDNASRAWLTVTSETIRMATSKGLTTALIPDYLAPLVKGRPAVRTLSFHSEGVRPGLVHFKPADLPDYVWMDTHGFAGWASLAQKDLTALDLPPQAAADSFFARHREKVLAGNISKYDQPDASKPIALPEHYVFVAMQIATDRTQQLARVPMLRMLDIVVDRFRDTDIKVVVKRHPLCKSKRVARRLAELSGSGEIILREDSIHLLVDRSLAVITVNSGVGSEAILHLKPIYLFGGADYACVTHQITSETDFKEATTPIRLAVPVEKMKQFLCYYREEYLVDITDRERLRSEIARRVLAS